MIKRFYNFVIWVSGLLGTWFFISMAWIIATGYFIFIPVRVMTGVRFYRALFPSQNLLYHLACVWKQYHCFTRVIIDRMYLLNYNALTYTSEGFHHLTEAIESKKGGVIIMSHMGNWDVAAHLLHEKGVKLLIYMGVKDKEQLEKMQKDHLKKRGITIVAVDKKGGSPFSIIEGLNFILDGGLVAISGDLLWHKNQRSTDVTFLRHHVKLPVAPYVLALKTGAPLFMFFSFRTGERDYTIGVTDPLYLKPGKRSEQDDVIRDAAQTYMDVVRGRLERHPYQWFHFEPFLGKKCD